MCTGFIASTYLVIVCFWFLPANSGTCGSKASQRDNKDVQDDDVRLLMWSKIHVERAMGGASNGGSESHMTHTDSADVKVVLQVNGSSNVSDMNSSEGGANAGDAGLLLAALGARASQLVTGIAGSTHNTLLFLIPALVTVGILVACVLWYESPQPATYTRTSTPGWTETKARPVQSSTSSTLAVTATPPMTLPSPLCPSMTLSGSESRFVISMKDVHSHGDTVGAQPATGMGRSSKRLPSITLIDPIGSGIVDIFGGLAGNVLLKARVHCDNRGQCVEIVTPDDHSRPRVTIGNLETPRCGKSTCGLKPKNTMDIRGPTSRGMILTEPWGQLEVHPEKSCIVTRSGDQVMKIDGEVDVMKIDGEVDAEPDCPRLLVTSADGRRKIASATVILEGRGDDYVDIRVNPGMDPALALALILSVLLFSPS